MTSTSAHVAGLSDAQLDELLELAKGVDGVELKLTLPESHHRSATTALGIDPLNVQLRQIYYLDTPDLALYKHGVVVRARRVQGRGDDSVVKLRPVVPAQLSANLQRLPNLVVEVDAMPGGYVCSATLKATFGATDVQEAVAGQRSVSALISKEQRAFYEAYAPRGVGLDDLVVLGPIFVLKLKVLPEELKRKLVAEMWIYPDYSRILELSTKCAPTKMRQVALETRQFLTNRGVDLSGEQQTKTRTALEFFSQRLAEGGG
jgi:hypothetical protein